MDSPAPPEAPPSGLMPVYDKLLLALDTVIGHVVIVAMAVLSSVLVVQVFYRYALNDSLDWGNDVPRLAFIVVILLSIPLCFRFNAHVGMDVDLTKLRFVSQAALNRFNAFFMLVLFAVVAFYAWQLMRRTWDQMMPGLDVPIGTFYLSLAIGMAHSCLHVGRILITGKLPTETRAE
jgi:TRAP-type C4-dicarboxylate transport system permease small subunit